MKIAVYLTLKEAKHVQSVMARQPGNVMEENVCAAATRAINAHEDRVRAAENLLARVRDSED